jgi:hypothetical protein
MVSQPASEPGGQPPREDLAARLSRALVGCYPPRWKQRYREEILDVLDQHQPSSRTVLSLAGGAMITHLDPDYRLEHPVIPPTFRTAVKGVAQIVGITLALLAVFAGLITLVYLPGILRDSRWRPNPAGGANVLAVTPDQRFLVTEVGGEVTAAVVTLWSVGHAGVQRLSAFEGGATVAIAPDGRLVATADFGNQAVLWSVARPRHPARLAVVSAGSSSNLWGAAFSPDSRLLAIAYGSALTLWDVARPARPRLLRVLPEHAGKVSGQAGITFSADGRLLAVESGNGQATIWNVARPARARRVATVSGPRRAGWFTGLAFSPAGPLLAGVTTSGTVLVFSLAHPARPVRTAIRRSLAPLALFPDGASGATSALPAGCPGCTVPEYALGFAPGGRALAVVMDRIMPDNSSRDTVLTWQVTASGALRDAAEATRNTWDGQPALAPDGRTVVDGQIFGGLRVRLWQVPPTPGET